MAVGDTLNDVFDLDEHDTNVRTELLAGLTTFLTMSYIVVVNPAILSNAIQPAGIDPARTFQMIAVVTIIAAAVATLVMAFYANRPFGQAPGLGLNAFFAFTVVGALGVPWQTALAAVVVEGLVFIALTAVGAREYIIRLFPEPVKLAVGAGIGLFLAIIGLEEMRVVAGDQATFLTFNPVFASDPVAVISVIGLLLTLALYARGIRGSIVLGIVLTSVAGYAASALGFSAFPADQAPPGTILKANIPLAPDVPIVYDAASYNIAPLAGAFVDGLGNVEAFSFALIVFTFFFVDFFDTAGTLTGVSQIAGFLDEDGNLPDMDRPLMADAIGTTVGGMLGTSTVTTYIESATGVEEGGRTGLTALVVALLFIASLAVVPLAAAVPTYASHLVLVVIGIVMLQNVVEIAWNDLAYAIPAGLTIIVMPFTFSIAYGIAAGIISYPIVRAAQDDWRDVRPGQWVLAALFVVYFFVRTGGVLG
jgi:AGZA family xanthine/uracil permease-like MFS transporter